MRKCPSCGLEITNEKVKFCYECGCKLEEVKNVEVITEAIEENNFYKNSRMKDNMFECYLGNDEHVVVPKDLKVLKYESFVNSGHKSITLSSGVEEIKDKAFRCPGLKKVYISETVKKIHPNAFGILYDNASECYFGCTDLEEIIVDEKNPYYKSIDGNLYSKDGKNLVRVAPGKKDSTIIIPEGVERVAGGATLFFTSTKKIVLPSTFGDGEFILLLPYFDSEKDKAIEIEINEKNPDYKVVNQVVYSKNGETLVMYNPSKVDNSFIIPNTVKIIDNCAFDGATHLEYVIIPNGITEIGECAFQGCENLTSVVIPNSVEEIGVSVFQDCEKLNNVSLPTGFEFIPAFTFSASGISNVVIPSSVKEIDEYAFESCSQLTEINIPANVKVLGEGAFSECYDLSLITLNEGLEIIGDYVFASSNIKSIKIPKTVKEIGVDVFDGCENLKEIYVSKGKKYNNLPSNVKIKEY